MKTQFLTTVALVIVFYPVLITTGFWVAFRRAGFAIKTVTFFRGPRLFTGTVFGDPVEIGCIPLAGSVAWVPEQFYSKSKLLRLGVVLVGPALGLAIAAILLGISAAGHHVGHGFYQLPLGALHPRTTALELITHLHAAFAQSPVTAVGILVAKGLACDLLPIGGATVTHCLVALGNSTSQDNRTIQLFTTLNALCSIALLVSWCVAIVSYAITAGP
jgi:membrane-associated protease RseP (regulator of RpoE activity)